MSTNEEALTKLLENSLAELNARLKDQSEKKAEYEKGLQVTRDYVNQLVGAIHAYTQMKTEIPQALLPPSPAKVEVQEIAPVEE